MSGQVLSICEVATDTMNSTGVSQPPLLSHSMLLSFITSMMLYLRPCPSFYSILSYHSHIIFVFLRFPFFHFSSLPSPSHIVSLLTLSTTSSIHFSPIHFTILFSSCLIFSLLHFASPHFSSSHFVLSLIHLLFIKFSSLLSSRVRDFPPDETSLIGVGMGYSQSGEQNLEFAV